MCGSVAPQSGVPDFPRRPEELPALTQQHRRARGWYDGEERADGGAMDVDGMAVKPEPT